MSTLAQAISYITGFFTPLTVSESPATDSHIIGLRKPIEAGESYFPEAGGVAVSRRSSVSSTSTGSDELRPVTLGRSHTGLNPLDPMSRDFSKPTEEIDVAKQLSLEPRKFSLHHSLKQAKERVVAIDDAETKAKKLAAAKAELLALAGKA
ncbi:hypothetical protein BKA67DRAFT_564812 [Truncatella angustata]|uniref:Uncharacterized protein n=1 Tax=Truncatella angustata TaxID=152316 RepID=A0A9P8ZXP7_9PEZI|nr:uncharacterized protein BKA67DRAFT_564812 [Truncatella angustata]KAH6654348.1 hypothetical protein BKA67DRAFT_564812 [Truncatella angustata]KAH8198505.1 hypothetical protein TruAng_007339 [Truncatella angustata]